MVVPDGFGYGIVLMCERESRKERKKSVYCIRMVGNVVHTEEGDVIYYFLNTTISADTRTVLSLSV